LYSGYAIPINGVVVDTNVVFNNATDVIQKSLDISDDIIYRRAYVSYDGASWTQFTLTPTGTATGEWIYGRGISSVSFSPAILHLNSTRNVSNNTYIIIYTCSKNITIHNWSCHDGWQIIPFNARLNVIISNSSSTFTWTNELMINGGFESGNLNGWTISGSGWTVGNHLNNAQYAVPQSGSYCVFVNGSSDSNNYIYQDVDLTSYSSYIDSGKAFMNASGWGVSSESPGQDLSRIQILFLNSAKGIIVTASDSSVVDNPSWWQKGISNYIIPSGTRYIRMWGNTYEQGYSSGNLDSFSVKVGYGGTPITPPTCTAETNAAFCLRLGKNCGTVTGIDNCSNPRTVTSCGQCTSPATCSGGGTANICGSTTCTPTTCSAQGKNCGTIADGCGNTLTCGSYSGGCQSGYTCNNGICTISTSTGTTYYISTSGNDGNSGTQSSPWKTLYKACSTVTKSGSTIHVNAGTYTETQQCQLAAGVSIEGEHTNPLTSIIVSTYAASLDNQYDASILLLSSSSSATDGDQSISYIKLDGNNLAGKRGISVRFRNYVSIHHCNVSNFDYSGVYFSGTTTGYPTITSSRYDHDNSIYNCNIINNAHGMDGTGIFGDLLYGAQLDLQVHDNVLDQTERSAGNNGDTLNGVYSKGLKMYNNVFYRNDNEGSEWNFFSEIFFIAGMDLYNNTFHGLATLDIVDVRKGAYDYGIKIYDNQFLVDTQVPETYHGIQAIDFEEVGQVQYAYVYNNHFKNSNTAVQFDATGTTHYKTPVNGVISMDHLYVYYNIFENMGAIGNQYYAAIAMKPESVDSPFNIVWNQIYIDNNVILSGSTYPTWCGIEWQQGGDYSNLYIRNNIIRGSSQYPIIFYDGGATVPGTQTNINIQNNLYYQNGANQVGYDGTSQSELTGLTQYTPTSADPSFKSSTDFHLNPGSPAIDKGVSTGWTSDYDGNSVPYPSGGATDIGAYEYR
jgi:hypothetical protein